MSARRSSLRLDYDFEPVPFGARRARRAGKLSPVEYDLLGFLYGISNREALARRGETPRLTRDAIADGIQWPHGIRSLVKMLQRLQREGWFSYRSERSKGGAYLFCFALKPDAVAAPSPLEAVERSPLDVTEWPLLEPDSPSRAVGVVAAGDDHAEAISSPLASDSSPLESSQSPHEEPDRASRPPEPVAAAQRFQREAKAGTEERPDEKHSVDGPHFDSTNDERLLAAIGRTNRDDHEQLPWHSFAARFSSNGHGAAVSIAEDRKHVWRDPPLDGEAGVMADCDALVAAGLAYWSDGPRRTA